MRLLLGHGGWPVNIETMMLSWRHPRANEVNFLPWFEQGLLTRRRQRIYFVVGLLCLGLLLLLPLGWQYYLWHQAQLQVQQQGQTGLTGLLVLQQKRWLESTSARTIEFNLQERNQSLLRAWLPARELAMFEATFSGHQRLVSWQWLHTDSGAIQIQFSMHIKQQWQDWWLRMIAARPQAKLVTLKEGTFGVTLQGHYEIAGRSNAASSTSPSRQLGVAHVVSDSGLYFLALRPASPSQTLAPQPVSVLLQQVSHLAGNISLSPNQKHLQLHSLLPPQLWHKLAPVPSATGWQLQQLSLQSQLVGPWQLTLTWQVVETSNTKPGLILGVPIEQQPSVLDSLLLLGSRLGALAPSLGATAEPRQLANLSLPFGFVGYSQRAGATPTVWLQRHKNGAIVRLGQGHSLDNWRLVRVSRQQLTFVQGQQQIELTRRCATGACAYE